MHLTAFLVFRIGIPSIRSWPGHMRENSSAMQALSVLAVDDVTLISELLHVTVLPAPIIPAQSPPMNPAYASHLRQGVVVVVTVVVIVVVVVALTVVTVVVVVTVVMVVVVLVVVVEVVVVEVVVVLVEVVVVLVVVVLVVVVVVLVVVVLVVVLLVVVVPV